MRTRLIVAGALASAAVLAGCQSVVDGTATRAGDATFTEPDFPTPRPTRPSSPAPSTPASPAPSGPARPGGEVLRPQGGYVFIETKSGKTRCQLDAQEVGCESAFSNAPEVDGLPANGVRINADGELQWVLGNLGAIPAVTLDYRTYSAVGWTIEADEMGTRFTNDRTGHGMVIAVEGVEAF